ncbi:MAG: sensor histidine kinase [Clostridiales bacterium]|nr:sensor histidine kinase [Candidatus Cacconaster stercorequi]
MKLFWVWLRGKRRALCLGVLCMAVFFAAFALYRLPMRAVCYPAALCLLVCGIFGAADFLRMKKTHETLCAMQHMTAAMLDNLPDTDDVLLRDYQALVENLRRETAQIQVADAGRYREMVDYYTVWAHQIKTPIAAMRLTLEQEDTPLQRRLNRELRRVEQYVEMVLAFLRLDSESHDYVFRMYSLDDIIRRSVRKFAPEFIDRHLRLVYDPTGEMVVTDEKWLAFVLEQLLSNALKYTPQGEIRIYMEMPKTLCIADTGIGIAPEDLPRVFEKGYTGYNGRMDKSASGIGLYLCRRICRNLGVTLSVSSQVGQGTTVRLDLSQYQGKTE